MKPGNLSMYLTWCQYQQLKKLTDKREFQCYWYIQRPFFMRGVFFDIMDCREIYKLREVER